MPTIHLTTQIQAPIHRCFDLARDIDAHKASATGTHEKAIAGRTSGLCELGDTVTWQAKHFGIVQHLTIQITQFDRPRFFEDTMLKGAFKSMRHGHWFEEKDGKTTMTDKFEYQVPGWIFGKLFDWLILRKHMETFLRTRNQVLKSMAEGAQ